MNDRFLTLLKQPRARRNAMLASVWLVLLGTLFAIREVLLPFLIASALAYVIEPIIRRLTRLTLRGRPLPRAVALLTVYAAFAAIVWIFIVFFVPQIYRELAGLVRDGRTFLSDVDQGRLDEMASRLEGFSRRMRLPIEVVTSDLAAVDTSPTGVPIEVDVVTGGPNELLQDDPPASDAEARAPSPPSSDAVFTVDITRLAKRVLEGAGDLMRDKSGQIVGRVQVVVGSVVQGVFSFFVVLMITGFLSLNPSRVSRAVFGLIPREWHRAVGSFLLRVDGGLSGVIRGQLTICLVNGLLTLIGLLLLNVKFAFLLATLAMIFSLVPIFGSILSTIPIVVVAIASGLWTAVLALAWIVGIHFIEANLLNPKIMGDAAKIHPVVIVVALIAGEHFYGLAGALFAVPLLSMALTLLRTVREHVAELDAKLGPEPTAPGALDHDGEAAI